VLAVRGKEGWESDVKLEEKEKVDVVGRINGNGILVCLPSQPTNRTEMRWDCLSRL
jgi:hypothetical protein